MRIIKELREEVLGSADSKEFSTENTEPAEIAEDAEMWRRGKAQDENTRGRAGERETRIVGTFEGWKVER